MPCYSPKQAWRCLVPDKLGKRPLIFNLSNGNEDFCEKLRLHCNKCLGCKLRRGQSWTIRCCHELSQPIVKPLASFITLTFDSIFLDYNNFASLDHSFFVDFMKRLREDLRVNEGIFIRDFHVGEYGTKFGLYWPALSHLGEQAVLNREIYTQGTAADLNVFGYQEVFSDYRYKNSRISGLFRSNATGSLDAWHLSQDFASLPTLNTTFIQENPPMARIKAVVTEPDFILDMYFGSRWARPMPTYAPPGLIDHF